MASPDRPLREDPEYVQGQIDALRPLACLAGQELAFASITQKSIAVG